MMLRIYLVTWRVWARKGWLPPGLPGYMKSVGRERMTAPWFTWLHEEYGQRKDDCRLVFLVTWRVWARKGWLPPGFPGYMKSMGKERMSAPWFTWLHDEYGQGKDVCPPECFSRQSLQKLWRQPGRTLASCICAWHSKQDKVESGVVPIK